MDSLFQFFMLIFQGICNLSNALYSILTLQINIPIKGVGLQAWIEALLGISETVPVSVMSMFLTGSAVTGFVLIPTLFVMSVVKKVVPGA